MNFCFSLSNGSRAQAKDFAQTLNCISRSASHSNSKHVTRAPLRQSHAQGRRTAASAERRYIISAPGIPPRSCLSKNIRIFSTDIFKSCAPGAFSATSIRCYSITPQRVQHNLTRKGSKKKRRLYTTEEDALIIDLRTRQRLGWKRVQEELPHRPIHSIRKRWEKHLRPNVDLESRTPLRVRYSAADAERLVRLRRDGLSWQQIHKEHFPDRTIYGLQDLFNSVFHFSYVPSSDHAQGPPYTSEEKEKLLNLRNVQDLPWAEIMKQIPGRTQSSLSTLYGRLLDKSIRKYPPWTTAEDETLRRLQAEGAGTSEIAKHIEGRSAPAVEARIRRLGLHATAK